MQDRIKQYRELAVLRRELGTQARQSMRSPYWWIGPGRDVGHAAYLKWREMDEIARSIDPLDSDAIRRFAALLDDEVCRGSAAYHLRDVICGSGPLADRAAAMQRGVWEAQLARSVQGYLKVEAAGWEPAAKEFAGSFSNTLEYLLPDLIRTSQGRKWEFWCDGVSDRILTVTSPPGVALVGMAYYGPGGSNWLAPIEADFELCDSGEMLKSYAVRFGAKAADGTISRVPYTRLESVRQQVVVDRPRDKEDWWFSFEKAEVR